MKEFTYTVKETLGLHARPAGLLVRCVKTLGSKVTIARGDEVTEGTRLMSIMAMGVKQGETVKVTVEGETEEEDVVVVRKFFEDNL